MNVTLQPPQMPLAPQFPKKKITAVLLAVFLTTWTWAYTYKVDAWKFWLNLALGLLTLGVWTILISWPWAIIDAARRPQDWYQTFPNGDALRLVAPHQPSPSAAALQPPAAAGGPATLPPPSGPMANLQQDGDHNPADQAS
jgi:hypothetical protein